MATRDLQLVVEEKVFQMFSVSGRICKTIVGNIAVVGTGRNSIFN